MATSIDLSGKSAIVTGSGRGIGRATALALAHAGASVVVNDLDGDAVEEVVATISEAGGKAAPAVHAIGSSEAAQACVETALSAFGRLDIMVTNAGNLRDRVLWNTGDEDFDSVIETHLRGTFTCARAAARHFREAGGGGRLILVSSLAGQRGNFGQTAYSAAKAGIAAMTRTWSMELAKTRVTVNAILPNALTRMTSTIPALQGYAEAAERGEPLPDNLRASFGIGTAEDVAPLAVFLASDRSSTITGQCIGIGGDRLSLWSHPQEKQVALCKGGWSADEIAERWASDFAGLEESVGITMDGL
ncbi:SDR family oxidoreductase [Rhizobium sp. NTR19]|uniref:SDR family oxidoreductase n=1 Tax=Neorhizobium turbinariae TaxID=2937795 RepID=A0ABT0INL5_9HYPH|nr:SDR family NAD(P)-dependent oxidoreductase [Neorhizobium turbinariae]MCK8779443.1 SDR family oxidoreductase [Neorhizobium turbinariae]